MLMEQSNDVLAAWTKIKRQRRRSGKSRGQVWNNGGPRPCSVEGDETYLSPEEYAARKCAPPEAPDQKWLRQCRERAMKKLADQKWADHLKDTADKPDYSPVGRKSL